MEKRLLAGNPNVGWLGLGTRTWGTITPFKECEAQFEAFVDAGGNLLDTAAAYGHGSSEKTLGHILQNVNRELLIVATKAGFDPRTDPPQDCSFKTLTGTLEQSLDRLQLSYVDLWQVHVWDSSTPLDETADALTWAISAGLVRSIGVSNYTPAQVDHLRSLLSQRGTESSLVSNQVEYSLVNRTIESTGFRDIELIAWSPLGRGVLTGKYLLGVPYDSRGASTSSLPVDVYFDDSSVELVKNIVYRASVMGVAPGALALAWLRDFGICNFALLGARTVAQLTESLAVVSLPRITGL